MIILSTTSFIKYISSEPLNLMSPPPKDAENHLYADYHNFINNILSIYETQTEKGSIPVFLTQPDDSNSFGYRQPDAKSTLKTLIPGRSYKIVVLNPTSIPLRVPNPIGLDRFLHPEEPQDQIICDKLISQNQYTNNIILMTSGQLSVNINIPIDKMVPDQTYSYAFTPTFSNWPATLSPTTGLITRSGPSITNGTASGNITSVFSYYPYLLDNLNNSIPYQINGNAYKDYYNNNVFTILNLTISNDTCNVYNNNYIISCDSCVPDHTQPTLSLIASTGNIRNFIHATASGLNPNIDYSFNFQTINSNWPTHIEPKSGLVLSKDHKNGLATIHSLLTFNVSLEDNWTNLNYVIENNSNDGISNKILYNDLELILSPIDNPMFNNISASTRISYKTTNYSDTMIRWAPQDSSLTTQYRYLSTEAANLHSNVAPTGRPKREYNWPSTVCCSDPQRLRAIVSNAVLGEIYNYEIDSYPKVNIIPSTGVFSSTISGDNINFLAYLEGQSSSSIYITLTHVESQAKTTDSMLLRCVQ